MAGPAPMALGPHQFEAHGLGYTEITRDLKTPHDELKVAQAFEVLHWTGPSSEDLTIKGCAFPESFGGLGTLDALRRDATAGLPHMLVSAGGTVYGRCVIVGVHEEMSRADANGQPRKVTYSLSLKRYHGAGALLPLLDLF